jgi:hypothetical protein
MSNAPNDEAAKKRIEEAHGRFQEAMRRVAPYVRRREVEEPTTTDEWRNGETAHRRMNIKLTENA